jgi:hypothetical protein
MAWYDVIERIEHKLDQVLSLLHTVQNQQKDFRMATQAELDALTASVAKNTSLSQSVATAVTGIVKTVTDLTAELKAALANATSVSDPAVVAGCSARCEQHPPWDGCPSPCSSSCNWNASGVSYHSSDSLHH